MSNYYGDPPGPVSPPPGGPGSPGPERDPMYRRTPCCCIVDSVEALPTTEEPIGDNCRLTTYPFYVTMKCVPRESGTATPPATAWHCPGTKDKKWFDMMRDFHLGGAMLHLPSGLNESGNGGDCRDNQCCPAEPGETPATGFDPAKCCKGYSLFWTHVTCPTSPGGAPWTPTTHPNK